MSNKTPKGEPTFRTRAWQHPEADPSVKLTLPSPEPEEPVWVYVMGE